MSINPNQTPGSRTTPAPGRFSTAVARPAPAPAPGGVTKGATAGAELVPIGVYADGSPARWRLPVIRDPRNARDFEKVAALARRQRSTRIGWASATRAEVRRLPLGSAAAQQRRHQSANAQARGTSRPWAHGAVLARPAVRGRSATARPQVVVEPKNPFDSWTLRAGGAAIGCAIAAPLALALNPSAAKGIALALVAVVVVVATVSSLRGAWRDRHLPPALKR